MALLYLALSTGGCGGGISYIVMMTMEGSTKIVNFMTTGAGVLVLGRGHISYIVKIHYSF